MSRYEDATSHALIPFTHHGAELPYRTRPRNLGDGILVTAARVHEGVWVSPRRGSQFHLAQDVAVAWEERGPVYGGRWLCGGKSIGIRFDRPEWLKEAWGKAMPVDVEDVLCHKCRQARDGAEKPAVYRAFDKADQLLYIGSSKNLPARLRSHHNSTWWWPVVKRVEHESFETLHAAREAEKKAIQAERPKMNVQHNRAAS